MQSRYMVRDQTLSPVHPIHPGRQVYFVYDRQKQEYSLAYYLTWEAANTVVEKRNAQNGITNSNR